MPDAKPETKPAPQAAPALALSLKQQLFVAVLAHLAGRGLPPQEAAEVAKSYAEAGAAYL